MIARLKRHLDLRSRANAMDSRSPTKRSSRRRGGCAYELGHALGTQLPAKWTSWHQLRHVHDIPTNSLFFQHSFLSTSITGTAREIFQERNLDFLPLWLTLFMFNYVCDASAHRHFDTKHSDHCISLHKSVWERSLPATMTIKTIRKQSSEVALNSIG